MPTLAELRPSKFGGEPFLIKPPGEFAVDVLAEPVAQLPEEPLTLVVALFPLMVEVLLLQLYAFATFGVVFKLTNNAAKEMAMPNAKPSLFMCSQTRRIDKRLL